MSSTFMSRAAAAAVLAVLWAASPAGAATRFVDDDRAQCRFAQFGSIQAALDAARPGDTIRVCAGVYREQIDVRTPRLGLISHPRHAATIAAPQEITRTPYALLVAFADRTKITGFQFVGPLPDVVEREEGSCDFHPHFSAIAVPAGSAVIRLNRFVAMTVKWCAADRRDVPAIHTGDVDASFGDGMTGPVVFDQNTVDGSGVFVEASLLRMTRNVVRGPGTSGASFAEWASMHATGNDVSGQVVGLRAGSGDEGRFTIRGNRVHDNDYGILAWAGGVETLIERNFADHNGYGLFVTGPGGGVVLRGNNARDNTTFDCFDGPWAGSWDREELIGTWIGNRGETANKPGLCRGAAVLQTAARAALTPPAAVVAGPEAHP